MKSGASIDVTNQDPAPHTVTSDGSEFNVSVDANAKKTFTAPAKAGSYPYHCIIHPTMKATLTVT